MSGLQNAIWLGLGVYEDRESHSESERKRRIGII